jgi:hypothetical protein
VSNVPGPPIPLYAAGARVAGIYPFGPLLEGAGLNFTILSNMGNVDFGVIACRELVPDVWSMAEGFGDAVLLLKKAADDAPAAAPTKKARPRKATAPAPDAPT